MVEVSTKVEHLGKYSMNRKEKSSLKRGVCNKKQGPGYRFDFIGSLVTPKGEAINFNLLPATCHFYITTKVFKKVVRYTHKKWCILFTDFCT